MASEAIKVPCRLWPHPTKNRNGSYGRLLFTTNDFVLSGMKAPDNLISDFCGRLTFPIDQAPNATPNAKLRVGLITDISGTSNFKLQLAGQKVVRGTTAVDFTGSFAGATIASAGAGIEKTLDLTISGTFSLGDEYEFTLRRDGSDAGDGIVGFILITEAVFISDT